MRLYNNKKSYLGLIFLLSITLLVMFSGVAAVYAANQKVSKLLPLCKKLLSRRVIHKPPSKKGGPPKNAIDCFHRVQALDANNKKAKKGILEIEKRYEVMATNSMKEGREKKAKKYIDRLRNINPMRADILEGKLISIKEIVTKWNVARQIKEERKKSRKSYGFRGRYSFESEKEYNDRINAYLQKVNANIGEEGYEVAEVVLNVREYNIEQGHFPLELKAKVWSKDLLKDIKKPYIILQRDEARKLYANRAKLKIYARLNSDLNLQDLLLFNGPQRFNVKTGRSNIKAGNFDINSGIEGIASTASGSYDGIEKKQVLLKGGKSTWQDPVTGMMFVWVPNGCFNMGSNSGNSDEKPIHKVCITKGFWMGKYEVTNSQYRTFDSSHDSKSLKGASLNDDNMPVVKVSWHDGEKFTQWLSTKGNGTFRIPTEAEWEYTARAGTNSQRHWGNGEEKACQYGNVYNPQKSSVFFLPDPVTFPCTDQFKITAPVGQFSPNQFGLHDMMGNVWEWVFDKYQRSFYDDSATNDPIGPLVSQFRVIRGGDWKQKPFNIRSSMRDKDTPGSKNSYLGLRILRESE
jgi:formylglycine-generating enzyme